jgi:hypothetical protein
MGKVEKVEREVEKVEKGRRLFFLVGDFFSSWFTLN